MRKAILVPCLLLGLAAGWTLQADPPNAGGKTPPLADQERIQKLIEQLGSKRFADREQADKELATIGPAALELLRRAAQSPDAEIKRRADKLVSRLEQQALTVEMLAPRRVRLTVTDVPVKEAVAELARLSGYKVELAGEQAGLSDRKITLDTGAVTFWEAVEQLCRKAGLAEQVNAAQHPVPFGQGAGGVVTI
ncbi:MAG TPA: hypothetical protein VEL76_39430, partial [Gemmataceae bacterium]|nr:hypothetical protein [Gemmataceae bacterium]